MEQDKPVLINDKDAAEFLQERITAQEQRVSAAMNELREAKAGNDILVYTEMITKFPIFLKIERIWAYSFDLWQWL